MSRSRTAAVAATTLVSAVLATSAVPALAGSGTGASAPAYRPLRAQTAVQLLQRALTAEAHTPFTGVALLVCWADEGTSTAVVDVVHRPGQGYLVRVQPNVAASDVVVDDDGLADAPPGATVSVTTLLSFLQRDYSLQVSGTDHIVGRLANIVTVVRPDGSAAARFWLDRASGLMLQRDVYDDTGRLTRTSTFVKLTVGRAGPLADAPAHTPAAVLSAPWQPNLRAAALAAMPRHGWPVPEQIDPAYRLVDARMGAVAEPVLQLTYTDGLSAISVFEQRGRLDTSRLQGWQRRVVVGASVWVSGAMPERLVWSADGMVYTVVSDAPPTMVREVVARLPHHTPGRSVLGRLCHGLARIASWLNPFG